MIRLSANLSRKVPIAGVQFSSQQFGASLEIEVSDADKPEAIQARIRELYDLLNRSIEEQITAASEAKGESAPGGNDQEPGGNGQPKAQPEARRNGRASPPRAQYRRNTGGNGQGNGGNAERRSAGATQAQQRAIFAICKQQGIEMADVLADYNVADARDLTVMDASKLIDDLKSRSA
ncbi:MAG: hypothetical protein AMXMBFR7_36860 [Planctomycetota bacterium]